MGLGTARTFNVPLTEENVAPRLEVMRLFLEAEGKMVDSSPMYGEAEKVIGHLLNELNMNDQVFYATKVWTKGEKEGMAQMDNSFKLMNTPKIHLMQVHNLSDTATQIKNIRALQEQGRVHYAGITHYTSSAFDDLERWIKKEKLDYVQFPYSITNRAAEKRLLSVAADKGVATIAHRNFEKGALFKKIRNTPLPDWAEEFDCQSWGNFFLKYLLADPRVTNLIPATRKPKHLVDNMNAGLGELPNPATRQKMISFIEQL